MGCACKGSKNVDYKIIYRGGEPSETVSTLSEVRAKLAKSSQGGNYRTVPRT